MPRSSRGSHRFKPRFGFGESQATTAPFEASLCTVLRRRNIVSEGCLPEPGLRKPSDKISTRLFAEFLFARLLRCKAVIASTIKLLPPAVLNRPNSLTNVLEVALRHCHRTSPLFNSSK